MKGLITLALGLFGTLSVFGDTTPSYPGGQSALESFLSKNIVYPQNARDNGVEGVVMVGFMVGPDGSLNNLKVLKPVDPDLEQEAIRVVGLMPSWIPAENNGTPIEAPSKVNIPFILEN